MAITDAYFTATEYLLRVGKTDTGSNTLIDLQAIAISRFLERECGQWFGKDATTSTRLYRAKWTDVLHLFDDLCPGLASTGSLAIKVDTDNDGDFSDETAWSSGDYQLWPLNAATGAEPRPYDRIVIPSYSNKRFLPHSLVQVVGQFGWPNVPAAIKEDAIKLLGIWRAEVPEATDRMSEFEQVVATSPLARSLVAHIRNDYAAKVTF